MGAEADTPNDGASGGGADDNTTAAGDNEDSAGDSVDDSSEDATTAAANDSGTGGDNGVDTSDGGASGDGADDNTTAAGDDEGGAGDDMDENDGDGEDGDDTIETESDEEDDGAGDGDGDPAFEEVIEEADSYEFEMVTKNEGNYRGEGRAHDGDTYTQWESGSETYLVDGQIYDINPELGLCMLMEEEDSEEGSIGNVYEGLEGTEITFAGTDTVDGEQMYVYEYTLAVSGEFEHEMTVYVSAETGYVLRLESGDLVTNYHSHGEADPIEAPDAGDIECIDISEGGV